MSGKSLTCDRTNGDAMFATLGKLFGANLECVPLEDEVTLIGKSICVACDGSAYKVIVGDKTLHLYPEPFISTPHSECSDLILVDPVECENATYGFKRIVPNKKLILGREDPEQCIFFNYSNKVAMRHLSIECKKGSILFKDFATTTGSKISRIKGETTHSLLLQKRMNSIREICPLYGGPLEILDPADAIVLLDKVNKAIGTEMYRKANRAGKPGRLIEIPDDKCPIILGDIHTNLDNLICILTQNNFLESLFNDKACLIIVGDAPHCELDGREGEMDSSLLIMDFIFKLKLLLPNNFFYLRGNHDSFSPHIRKAGINQGALWKKKVLDTRGEDYFDAMNTFYKNLPLVAVGKDFITCHAGPTKSPMNREEINNLQESDCGYNELLWTRVKSPRQPAGYVTSTVRNFKKGLGFTEETPLIVGHTPPTQDSTLWLDVGGIKNHHVLFNSRLEGVPVFTRIGDTVMALMYRHEKLVSVL